MPGSARDPIHRRSLVRLPGLHKKGSHCPALEGNAPLAGLLLGPLMAIDTDLDRIRRIAAYLDERWTEILVLDVEVVVVDKDRLAGVVETDRLSYVRLLALKADALSCPTPTR